MIYHLQTREIDTNEDKVLLQTNLRFLAQSTSLKSQFHVVQHPTDSPRTSQAFACFLNICSLHLSLSLAYHAVVHSSLEHLIAEELRKCLEHISPLRGQAWISVQNQSNFNAAEFINLHKTLRKEPDQEQHRSSTERRHDYRCEANDGGYISHISRLTPTKGQPDSKKKVKVS